MLNSKQVAARASALLMSRGFPPELSIQARAVTAAIVEAFNAEMLDLQASVDKQINAVKMTPTGRMKKPTLDEVKAHGLVITLPESECCKFFDHFESNGWK